MIAQKPLTKREKRSKLKKLEVVADDASGMLRDVIRELHLPMSLEVEISTHLYDIMDALREEIITQWRNA